MSKVQVWGLTTCHIVSQTIVIAESEENNMLNKSKWDYLHICAISLRHKIALEKAIAPLFSDLVLQRCYGYAAYWHANCLTSHLRPGLNDCFLSKVCNGTLEKLGKMGERSERTQGWLVWGCFLNFHSFKIHTLVFLKQFIPLRSPIVTFL